MSAVLTPADVADVSANVGPVPGGRATKIKGQIVHIVPAAMIDVQAVATMLGCSPRHVYRLADAGAMPRPVKLGSLVRWSTAAIREWIDGGCKPIRQVKGGA